MFGFLSYNWITKNAFTKEFASREKILSNTKYYQHCKESHIYPSNTTNCLQVSSVLLRRETRILNLETSVVIVTGRFNKWSVLVLLVGQPTRNVVQNLDWNINGLGPSADKRHVQVLQSHRRQTDQTITSDNSPLNRRKTDTFYRTLLLATWTKTERDQTSLAAKHYITTLRA